MFKLNVGLTRKTSEVDPAFCYASTNLEVELDPDLVHQPSSRRAACRWRLTQLTITMENTQTAEPISRNQRVVALAKPLL